MGVARDHLDRGAHGDGDVRLRRQAGEHGGPTCQENNLDYTAATANSDDVNYTIVAPGVCVRSTWKGDRKCKSGTCQTVSGTSLASSHVAGTTALCSASRNCTGTPQEDMNNLRSDAENKSNLTATTPYYGFTGAPN